MKLFEALALKKSKQAQLAESISLRNSTFELPTDEEPEFKYADLTEDIKQKVKDITKLKLAIMRSNMETKLPNGMTLAEGIIELANVRSAIDQMKELIQVRGHGLYVSDRRRNTTELPTTKQEAPAKIRERIEKYDQERRLLDSMIQEANHTVEINWPQ